MLKITPYLGAIVLIVAFGGLWYPVLGYMMFVVMATLFITSIFRGRWFCGNLCPRGSYFDHGIIKISKKSKIPDILSSMWLRIPLFSFMIGMMAYRIASTFAAQNTFELIGTVLVSMCLMTTIIGSLLGTAFNSRSWCSVCPMGTMQRFIGGNKYQLHMDHDTCVDCKKCEKVCPMQLKVRDIGNNPDCIKCGKCIDSCPKDSLSF